MRGIHVFKAADMIQQTGGSGEGSTASCEPTWHLFMMRFHVLQKARGLGGTAPTVCKPKERCRFDEDL